MRKKSEVKFQQVVPMRFQMKLRRKVEGAWLFARFLAMRFPFGVGARLPELEESDLFSEFDDLGLLLRDMA